MRSKKEIEREINIIKAELRGETKDNEDKLSKGKINDTKASKTKVSERKGQLKWNKNLT